MTIWKAQNYIVQGTTIFFIGMIIQFLAHTIFTYGIGIPSWLSFIRLWKEFIIAGMWLLSIYVLYNYRSYLVKLLNNKHNVIIMISIIISLLVSLLISIIVHNQSIITFLISAKFNYIPLIILCVGILIGNIIENDQKAKILDTIITTIKYVLIFSLIRYGILHTIPNILDWIWFSQPGMSIERTAWTPPPSLYLTDFYSGYVRNQWPFWWPLSLWFYLVSLRPLFFTKVFYKKNFSDTRGRWLLYISMVISTYSRATRIIFFVSCLLLWLILYKKHRKKIIVWWVILIALVWVYISLWWESSLFVRTRSDKWHIEFLQEGFALIKENFLRWLWAASVWPWSNHIEWVKEVFNPENQYMQIRLEYGLFWMIWRLLSYLTITRWSIKSYINQLKNKYNDIDNNTLPYIGISISIVSLSIAGMVLHPFTDSSSMYPFMLLCGILLWSYTKSENTRNTTIIKEINQNIKTTKSIGGNFNSLHLLKIRTVIIWLFFTIQTVFVSGFHFTPNTVILSSIRDVLFILSMIYLLFTQKTYIKSFYNNYKYLIRSLWGLLIINIAYIINSTSKFELLELLAGIKYDIYYFYILLWWLWLGHLFSYYNKGETISKYIKWFWKFIFFIIIWWLIRQWLKTFYPDLFTHYLWFSTPSDFVPFTNPPIYYITWPWGIQRLSGFFVWPNTLGFFMIVISWLLYYLNKTYLKTIKSRRLRILYILIIWMTLSRGAVIGSMIVIILLWITEKMIINKETIKDMISKIPKKIWVIILTVAISTIMFLWINQRKDSSNNERLSTLNTSLEIVYKKISLFGYGAWYSWPARHYQSDYQNNQKNDLSMLENIYLQLIINQWIIWIILFITILFQLYTYHTIIRNNIGKIEYQYGEILYYTQYLGIWLLWLLSIWWFLHVFIDSMVNYLFFIAYGICLWYSVSIIKKDYLSIQK